MTTFQAFRPSFANASNLIPLQQAIAKGSYGGTIRYGIYGPPEITARLDAVADAVESAFVLTPKDDLPKVTSSHSVTDGRAFHVPGQGSYSVPGGEFTAEFARSRAAALHAIAILLDAEEKAAADTAKKAETDRTKRLNELASKYFGADFFSDLGERKARVIEDFYKLEQPFTGAGEAA
jgi:hypothetical protein